MLKSEKDELIRELFREKIRMERINYLQEKHEILEYLDLLELEKYKIENEKEILIRLIQKSKFTNVNNIWVLTNTFIQGKDSSYEDIFTYLNDVSFDYENAYARKYINIENLKVNLAYFNKINDNITVKEFEKENTILNPYNSVKNIECLNDIRYDFIKNSIDKNDKEAKELILKKYKRN